MKQVYKVVNYTRVYAWFNGIPMCKVYDNGTCVWEELTDERNIKEHNMSPVSCITGKVCWNCVTTERKRREENEPEMKYFRGDVLIGEKLELTDVAIMIGIVAFLVLLS